MGRSDLHFSLFYRAITLELDMLFRTMHVEALPVASFHPFTYCYHHNRHKEYTIFDASTERPRYPDIPGN